VDVAELSGVLDRVRTLAVTPFGRAYLVTAEAELAGLAADGDADRWAAAAAAWNELGCPYSSGYAAWRQAEALLRRNGGRAAAGAAIAQAHAVARRLGAHPLRTGIEALARRARLTVSTPDRLNAVTASVAGTPTHNGLTPREHEVLRLISAGRTNRQVAHELFISEKTVSIHVSHILAKLGAQTRNEAAAIARRLGVLGSD
jgi:DNA-binding CsgD family transcriptional regulator